MLDYKKQYKELYLPGPAPVIVTVPPILFIAVEGEGDPNTSDSYREALEILYGLTYTIKMSKMGGNAPEGYFEYTVPPLEGLWRLKSGEGFDGRHITDKGQFCWTSMIRQPEFVTQAVFEAAKTAFARKHPAPDTGRARLWLYDEGPCAQIMHHGPYDDEPATVERLEAFIALSEYDDDITDERPHHEIYLGDPRRTAPEKLRTVLRHPVKKRV